jgi:hypothetical protein
MALIRVPEESAYTPPVLPEYRPTGGGTTQTEILGGGNVGDDGDPPEQEESLLGGGGDGGEAEDSGLAHEFSPASPLPSSSNLPTKGGPGPATVSYDPYAQLDGLFNSDAPQPLSANDAQRFGGQRHVDDLLF